MGTDKKQSPYVAMRNTNADESEEEEDEENEQEVEHQSCGGYPGEITCFAMFEGFQFVFITMAFMGVMYGSIHGFPQVQQPPASYYNGTNVPNATQTIPFGTGLHVAPFLLICCLGYCFHCCTQCCIGCFDPAQVDETLASIEKNIDDERMVEILDELRATPPKVTMVGEAFHTESTSTDDSSTTSTVIDHHEEKEFLYCSWKDISGNIVDLANYPVVAVSVEPEVSYADEQTQHARAIEMKRLEDNCKRYRQSIRSWTKTSVPHAKYPVEANPNKGRVFVTRSSDMVHSGWMDSGVYSCLRFLYPLLGTLYRIAFWCKMTRLRFRLKKSVTILSREESGFQIV